MAASEHATVLLGVLHAVASIMKMMLVLLTGVRAVGNRRTRLRLEERLNENHS